MFMRKPVLFPANQSRSRANASADGRAHSTAGCRLSAETARADSSLSAGNMFRLRLCLAISSLWFTALAEASPNPDAFAREAREQIAAESEEGARLFEEANRARDEKNLEAASALYAKVIELAPKSTHAVRRRCVVEVVLGNHARALELCRAALAKEKTVENHVAYAFALRSLPANQQTADTLREVEREVDQALSLAPDEVAALRLRCDLAIARLDGERLTSCITSLKALPPGRGQSLGHFFAGLRAVHREAWGEARQELALARAAGLPLEESELLLSVIDAYEPYYLRFLDVASPLIAAWAASFVLLLALGFVLSAMTLRASRRVPREAHGHPTGPDAVLRKVYRVVLWLSCAYYFVSLPIIVLLVFGVGALMVQAMLAAGRIPIKLVAIVGFVVIATAWAVLKSLFVRAVESEPGDNLDPRAHPRLAAALNEVAASVGTRPVDAVFMTPGTDIAVFERGGIYKQLGGTTERCLILGAGVLQGMKVREFKGILAHEYGHFQNEDTAGGCFSLAMQRSLFAMAASLGQNGAATWYNPAWLFLRGFYWVFIRISHGASRLQEVLADRWAAFTYGSRAFERGLTHAIAQSIRFDQRAEEAIRTAIEQRAPLANFYVDETPEHARSGEVEQAIEDALTAPGSPFDSHPPPVERIAWVRLIDAEGVPQATDDAADAWTLFEQPDAIREALVRQVSIAISTGLAA
jgi:Zn-dependent protease with chaperone function